MVMELPDSGPDVLRRCRRLEARFAAGAAFTVGFLLGLAASAELAPLASHWIISDYKITLCWICPGEVYCRGSGSAGGHSRARGIGGVIFQRSARLGSDTGRSA